MEIFTNSNFDLEKNMLKNKPIPIPRRSFWLNQMHFIHGQRLELLFDQVNGEENLVLPNYIYTSALPI
jgi:hypothetical protein